METSGERLSSREMLDQPARLEDLGNLARALLGFESEIYNFDTGFHEVTSRFPYDVAYTETTSFGAHERCTVRTCKITPPGPLGVPSTGKYYVVVIETVERYTGVRETTVAAADTYSNPIWDEFARSPMTMGEATVLLTDLRPPSEDYGTTSHCGPWAA